MVLFAGILIKFPGGEHALCCWSILGVMSKAHNRTRLDWRLSLATALAAIACWPVASQPPSFTPAPAKAAVTTNSNPLDTVFFDGFNPTIKSEWIRTAFTSLESGTFPRIKAISWWHENFDNSLLRVDSSMESLMAYRQGISSALVASQPVFNGTDPILVPVAGIYHAAIPDFGGTEDMVTANRIGNFEDLVNKPLAWVYFSNNWVNGIQFPLTAVNSILALNRTPFIRMMPRSHFDEGGPDPVYTMQRFLDGGFDADLMQWCMDAAATDAPLLVEFGTEVNGNWFPWNGQYNGGGNSTGYGDPGLADGPERFRDTYRHIIDLCDNAGANNITWFFHVDAYSQPENSWNNMSNYYPGDEYIDWLGLSVYGPQQPGETFQEFEEILNDAYPELSAVGNKPMAILEWGITEL